jgi:hypothetical protein
MHKALISTALTVFFLTCIVSDSSQVFRSVKNYAVSLTQLYSDVTWDFSLQSSAAGSLSGSGSTRTYTAPSSASGDGSDVVTAIWSRSGCSTRTCTATIFYAAAVVPPTCATSVTVTAVTN